MMRLDYIRPAGGYNGAQLRNDEGIEYTLFVNYVGLDAGLRERGQKVVGHGRLPPERHDRQNNGWPAGIGLPGMPCKLDQIFCRASD